MDWEEVNIRRRKMLKRKWHNFLWFIVPRIDHLSEGWFIRWLGMEYFIRHWR